MAQHHLILLLAVSFALPSMTQAQTEETYHERLEYNAETGKWDEIAPPIPGTEEGDLAVARSYLAQGQYKAARRAFKNWFGMYADSSLMPEALFYAAETEVTAEDVKPKRGDLMQAYRWLEQILEGWPGSAQADRALRKELIIAEMILFKNHKQRLWKGMLWLSATEEALNILNRIIDFWKPKSPIAEQALRLMADYHYIHGEFEEAELAYKRLVNDYPRGRYHKIAMLRSGQSALARFPGVAFDEADLLEAEAYLKDFHESYPQEAADYEVPQMLSRISESKAEKEYTIARYYERTKAIDSAVYYYRWIVEHYASTTWADDAQNRLIALGAVEYEADGDDQTAWEDASNPDDPASSKSPQAAKKLARDDDGEK